MKRGIWLSTNFLVIILISLVALGMGIYLTEKFFGTAQDVQQQIDTQTEKEIERLMFEGERVSIPFNRKDVSRGSGEVFGLGIHNTLDSGPDFTVAIKDGPLIQQGGSEISPGDPEFTGLRYISEREVNIENNEFKIFSVPVSVSGDNLIGTYVLNIYVCDSSISGDCDGSPEDELYDGFVHKIYVEVR